MKKGLLLLLALVLLLPFQIKAEEEWYYYESNINSMDCIVSTVAASEIVTYENGVYQLVESFSLSPNRWGDSLPTRLYCIYNGVNDVVYIMYKESTCRTGSVNGKIGYKLTDGRKELETVYIGTEYQFNNGSYTLTEYEEIPITQVQNAAYFSDNYQGYYICMDYSKTCSNLYRIGNKGNTIVGGYSYSQLENVEGYYLLSDTFKRENDQFVLINPKKVYLASSGGEGYSCRSHEATCDVLYKIRIDDYYDRGRMAEYNELTISNRSIDLGLKTTENYDLKTFFSQQEISHLFSTNPDIAEIKNNQLVLYKAGTTDIIYEDNTTYKVIHLRVTESALGKNPKTSNTSVFTIILGVLLIVVLIIEQRKGLE